MDDGGTLGIGHFRSGMPNCRYALPDSRDFRVKRGHAGYEVVERGKGIGPVGLLLHRQPQEPCDAVVAHRLPAGLCKEPREKDV